jgi:hypothetical protein
VFYSRAAQPRAGGAPVFHDTTGGSNSVPGQTGFAAVVGYDQVNGLGSINASLLLSQSDAATVCAVKVAPPVVSGNHNSVALMVTVSGGFNASVAFSVAGLPRGLSATFPPVTLSAPGSGSGLLKITAPSGVRIGTLFCHCFSYQWEARSSGYHCPPQTRAYASFIANRDRGVCLYFVPAAFTSGGVAKSVLGASLRRGPQRFEGNYSETEAGSCIAETTASR